jgi:UDP-N-acetylglucosamine 4,6-dehydratase/5-epimerase
MNLKNKKILITGGSGSLGRALICELLKRDAGEIISLSRDEGLIKSAEAEITSPKVTFRVGDIRDIGTIGKILRGIDLVYHTAAMKHVGLSEKYPREVIHTNIFGLLNLLDASENVSRFINISSDKAIGVVNCYGATKLLQEYLVMETNSLFNGNFVNIRFPNLFDSRGSVIDRGKQELLKSNTVTTTDKNMTRYFILLADAAKCVVETSLLTKLDTEKIYFPKSGVKKFRVGDLAEAFVEVFGNKKTKIKEAGAGKWEKIHEEYLPYVRLCKKIELVKILRDL